MKPVSELLKRHDGTLWHVRPEDTVYEALRLLAQYEVGALLAVSMVGSINIARDDKERE